MTSIGIRTVFGRLDLLLSTHKHERKMSEGRISTVLVRHPYYGRSPPIYRLGECKIFTKALIFMSISTDNP